MTPVFPPTSLFFFHLSWVPESLFVKPHFFDSVFLIIFSLIFCRFFSTFLFFSLSFSLFPLPSLSCSCRVFLSPLTFVCPSTPLSPPGSKTQDRQAEDPKFSTQPQSCSCKSTPPLIGCQRGFAFIFIFIFFPEILFLSLSLDPTRLTL